MDARLARCALLLAAAVASLGASYRTENFIVNAPSPRMAEQIGRAAEVFRRDLAISWLGHELPNWREPCPITAQVAENLGAGGATSFVFDHGDVFGWRMTIQGSLVRILDSVLPHEVTHTVFATHFRQPLPRWADEGACTTVEHASERDKQQTMLVDFLRTGRGIAFSQMFAMKEYPRDVMPLYSQGYSLARYLVAHGGRHKFMEFVGDGLRDENWTRALQQHYEFSSLAVLQNEWLDWVRKGSPIRDLAKNNETLVAVRSTAPSDVRQGGRAKTTDLDLRGNVNLADRANPRDLRFDGPSVYEVATSKKALRPKPSDSEDAWHAPHGRSALAKVDPDAADAKEEGARAGSGASPSDARQVTRPQPTEPLRQVILEWSRPR